MLAEIGETNPFTDYADLLTQIDATADDALQRMWENHQFAVTRYSVDSILQLFKSNLTANQKKYDELIEFYEEKFYPFDDYYRNESYDHTRTPNLNSESVSISSGNATTNRQQSHTTTRTPNTTDTNTHLVQPYDSNLRTEFQDISENHGTDTTVDSWSGQPDITTASSTVDNAVTTTGTDKNKYDKIIHGRNGNRPTSEVVADGLRAAAMHDILDIIINDIADQIFLQVWI